MNAEDKAERERLESIMTPEQLMEYDKLRAQIKRELTDAMAGPLKRMVGGLVDDKFAEDFEEGFRNGLATGGARQGFEESMEDELGRE